MAHRGFRSVKPVSDERRDTTRTIHTALASADGLWLVCGKHAHDGVISRMILSQKPMPSQQLELPLQKGAEN